jgi:predicted peptidase
MNRFFPLVIAMLMVYSNRLIAAEPAPGKQVAAEATVKVKSDTAGEREVTLRYLLFVPEAYDADTSKRWPLLLFLHGSGERGDDLELVKKHGPPKLVQSQPDFQFVVISPQCPKDSRWNAAELAKLVEQATNNYRIDKRRVYATGLSMGGSGTWALLAEHPGLFAAAAPLCGRGDVERAEAIAKTPVWAFVGDKDKEETVKANDDMNAALIKAGGNVRLTVYPGVGHDCWTKTYENPELYSWLFAHPRAGN